MPRQTGPANRKASPRRTLLAMLLLTFSALALPAPSALAGITSFDAFGNIEYTETATGLSNPPQYFFASRLFYTNAGDVTSATGTSGSAPQFNYTPQPGNFALFQTGFISQAQLLSYLQPPGSMFNATVNSGNLAGQSGSSFLGQTLFAIEPPALTFGYVELLNFISQKDNFISFNRFNPAFGSPESDIFITITRTSDNATVFSSGALSDLTQTIDIAAYTLAPGTTYNLEIDFSSRIKTPNAGFNGATFTAGYDVRTEAAFTTLGSPVPEPASLALTTLGLASTGLASRRRRSRPSA